MELLNKSKSNPKDINDIFDIVNDALRYLEIMVMMNMKKQ